MNYLQHKKQFLTSQIKQGVLPFGYKQVEYLESTGTQYIDTGFIPTEKTKSSVEMQCTDWTTMRANFFGAGDYTINARFNVGMNISKTYFQWNIADKYYENITVRNTNRILITMDAPNKMITFGDTKITKIEPNYNLINNGTLTFWLFSASSAYKSYCKIFNCKIWNENKIVRDLIPCIDSNNKPCMYDTVSKKTFYNQGTGEFLYGEVIN